MNKSIKVLQFILLLAVYHTNTAVFRVFNNTAGGVSNLAGSKIKVRVTWNGGGAGYFELNPGQDSGGIDSGFNDIAQIIYEEVIPQTESQKKESIFCTRRYIADLGINAWAVGGKIYIQSNADVSYSFDTIAGSGTRKARPYNG